MQTSIVAPYYLGYDNIIFGNHCSMSTQIFTQSFNLPSDCSLSPRPFSESMDNLLSLNSVIFESLSHGNVSPVLHCYSLHPGLDHRNRPITHTPGSFIGLTQDIQSRPRWKACGPRIRGHHTHS